MRIRTKPLGHRKGRAYFPIQERFKPLLLLLCVTVASQYLWIRRSKKKPRRRVSESDSHKNVPRALPMLPVSGAEQFVTSEPMCPLRPIISAMTAYCTIQAA